ncbi:MAG TPA: LPS assembly lipoprotein LptE [Burkholderiaceae bacterium]|nr:LPS assembly lipoprotein LptE [Burkholderiaceae bacterium]
MQKRAVLYVLMLAMTVGLSACGFQLRGADGSATLPFRTIYLTTPDTSSLGNELKRYIGATGVTAVTDQPKAAEAIIELLSEARGKTVLSLNTQGRVREYSLLYKVRFRVTDSLGKELLVPTEIVLKREIGFNEAQVIAKEQEEELLYRDMQSDLVQQILRRLAALKPA